MVGSEMAATGSGTGGRRRPPGFALGSVTLTVTLALVIVGGFTRGSESGYGCEDQWPLCQDGLLGGLLPRADFHMIVEWSHRWIAAWMGVLTVATAVAAWRHHRRRPVAVWAAMAAVVAVVAQALAGRAVVQAQLDADLVTLHLTLSMLIVALLVVFLVSIADGRVALVRPDPVWVGLATLGATAAFAILIAGSLVHNVYVPGWPLARDAVLPDFGSGTDTVHYLHRVLAAGGAAYLVYLSFASRRRRRPTGERWLTDTASALAVANIGLGAAHVFTEVESAALVSGHLGFSAVVWTAMVGVVAMAAYATYAGSGSQVAEQTERAESGHGRRARTQSA